MPVAYWDSAGALHRVVQEEVVWLAQVRRLTRVW